MKLRDVYQEAPAIGSITTLVNRAQYDDGVLVKVNGAYRVVVENCRGKLMCHVWATGASIDNDPTHSIEIEREETA